ncbi:MAG: Hsp70 family protein [Lachnospiraceae bacterium]
MALIGIDLGTTNSLVTIYRDGKTELIPNALGSYLTPSVVSIDEAGDICVGAAAKERLVSHPDRTAASFKRLMGTGQKITLANQEFTPQELSSFVLRQLKADAEAYLDEDVTEAVISVPAYFDDYQRYATKEAGLLAGLTVERLINEPSAAALAARGEDESDQSYLVFDFGGGTLDVSIVDCFENVVEIVAVSGDNQLGGNDFDGLIAEYFCNQHDLRFGQLSARDRATLLRLAEKSKRELTANKASVLKMEIEGKERAVFLSHQELISISYDIFGKISAVVTRALKDSKKSMDEIDDIVLVGGSSKMPVISYYLKKKLDKNPVVLGSPDEMVAVGAGVFAGIKARNKDIKELVLTDICPFTLGTNVVNYADNSRPIMSPIIERNSILPTSKNQFYSNAYDNQARIEIGIYQGEAFHVEDNLKLGAISMDILAMPKGAVGIEVYFSYDINGILEVEVIDHTKKERKKTVLVSQQLKMSETEIAKRLQVLHNLKLQPPGSERVRYVIAKGERLFVETTGEKREKVAEMLQWLGEALRTRNDQEISQRSKIAAAFFRELEE